MRKSKFSETQIVGILKDAESGDQEHRAGEQVQAEVKGKRSQPEGAIEVPEAAEKQHLWQHRLPLAQQARPPGVPPPVGLLRVRAAVRRTSQRVRHRLSFHRRCRGSRAKCPARTTLAMMNTKTPR